MAYIAGNMNTKVNESEVGDTAKLMVHRLIARQIRRDPTLIDRARNVHARQADQFEGWPFVPEWEALLSLTTSELASKLVSRDRDMVRLRNSSPFYLADKLLKNGEFRLRIARAARRLAEQSGGFRQAPSRGS
jgi:hypothetical protein